MSLRRTLFRTCAWAVAAALLAEVSHFMVEMEHNVMAWDPQGFTLNTAIAVALYTAALGGFHLAGRGAESHVGAAVAIFLALLLALDGLHGLPGYLGDLVKPREPAPVEYRLLRAVMMTLPLVVVGVSLMRRRKDCPVRRTHPSEAGDRPRIASRVPPVQTGRDERNGCACRVAVGDRQRADVGVVAVRAGSGWSSRVSRCAARGRVGGPRSDGAGVAHAAWRQAGAPAVLQAALAAQGHERDAPQPTAG